MSRVLCLHRRRHRSALFGLILHKVNTCLNEFFFLFFPAARRNLPWEKQYVGFLSQSAPLHRAPGDSVKAVVCQKDPKGHICLSRKNKCLVGFFVCFFFSFFALEQKIIIIQKFHLFFPACEAVLNSLAAFYTFWFYTKKSSVRLPQSVNPE